MNQPKSKSAPASDNAVRETRRFKERQEQILDAASALINEVGAAGMTLSAVAERVGLNTASITYYFRRRDDLALACYHRALAEIEAMVDEAAAAGDARARVSALTAIHIERQRRVHLGEARPITVLSDIRSMDDPVRVALAERYRAILRRVRSFFTDAAGAPVPKAIGVARTHVLIENLYWLPAWIVRYDVADYDRVHARMMEVFTRGLRPAGGSGDWMAGVGETRLGEAPAPMTAQDRFLLAATRLINERGYRGASVDRIASELNVTKGSFYHHLDAKDELVMACFARSFALVAEIQQATDRDGVNQWDHLASSLLRLLAIQFSDHGPLLRMSALAALPQGFRTNVIDASNRMARRFAGTMIDGISEGSIHAVDPLVASQMLMASVNSATELRRWAGTMPRRDAIRLYGSALTDGLFAPCN